MGGKCLPGCFPLHRTPRAAAAGDGTLPVLMGSGWPWALAWSCPAWSVPAHGMQNVASLLDASQKEGSAWCSNLPHHGVLPKWRRFLPDAAKPSLWTLMGQLGMARRPPATFQTTCTKHCIENSTLTGFLKTLRATPMPRAQFHVKCGGAGRMHPLFAGQGGRGEGWGRAALCPLFVFTCVLCVWLLG